MLFTMDVLAYLELFWISSVNCGTTGISWSVEVTGLNSLPKVDLLPETRCNPDSGYDSLSEGVLNQIRNSTNQNVNKKTTIFMSSAILLSISKYKYK